MSAFRDDNLPDEHSQIEMDCDEEIQSPFVIEVVARMIDARAWSRWGYVFKIIRRRKARDKARQIICVIGGFHMAGLNWNEQYPPSPVPTLRGYAPPSAKD